MHCTVVFIKYILEKCAVLYFNLHSGGKKKKMKLFNPLDSVLSQAISSRSRILSTVATGVLTRNASKVMENGPKFI